jgi:porphobilinogen synthase
MFFPFYRPRRLRRNKSIRSIVRENSVEATDLVMPFFVKHGRGLREPVKSMPGVFRLSTDSIVKEVQQVYELGIPAVLLFGIPREKDEFGSEAYAHNGIIQQTVRAIKKEVKEALVITDVCLCEYTSHGHCGILGRKGRTKDVTVDNDKTLKYLAKIAVSHADAGADIIAPSDMMDGRIRAIREGLDRNGFEDIAIMAYSAKYASAFYGPFREAAESAPGFGDRKSYQMDPSNVREAVREVALDIEEGADIVMVKPALAYLDVIRIVKEEFGYPVAAYNVSGEFSMVKAAAQKGWIDEKNVTLEILTAMKRAGADIIITYAARDVAAWIG